MITSRSKTPFVTSYIYNIEYSKAYLQTSFGLCNCGCYLTLNNIRVVKRSLLYKIVQYGESYNSISFNLRTCILIFYAGGKTKHKTVVTKVKLVSTCVFIIVFDNNHVNNFNDGSSIICFVRQCSNFANWAQLLELNYFITRRFYKEV